MEQYCYKRKADGQYIINLKTLWEKLLLAARAIAAIENPGKKASSPGSLGPCTESQ